MSDGRPLDRLQEHVADRDPVDWDSIDLQAFSPADIEQLKLLRLLDTIGVAHRTFQAEQAGDDERQDPAPPPTAHPAGDETVKAWGRYRLDEKVGRGGFGSVYRGWDPALEMPVAIKILHRHLDDARLKDRLLHEGRALAQVKHTNVVRVLTVEEHANRLGLVMEFLRGDTLDTLVGARGMLNEREASVIGEDVCRALSAVHANKLVHRDVKARNILRERTGRIVLMDFGTGLRAEVGPGDGRGAGTPIYMAPEVLKGGSATVASDIYSLGVLLFFLVTGKYPYVEASIEALEAAQAAGRRRSLLELRPDLPMTFVTVVDRALAPDPRDRYPSAAAMLRALVDARNDTPRWRSIASRVLLAAACLVMALTVAGFVSWAAFNQTLGRTSYATDSFLDWFECGGRSLVLPIALALLIAGSVGVAAAARNVALAMSSRLCALDRTITGWLGAQVQRLALDQAAVASCWLVLITAVALGAVWKQWVPLLRAITSDVNTAPAEVLAALSPAAADYNVNYRIALSLLAAFTVAAWYWLIRVAVRREQAIPAYTKAGGAAVLLLLLASMQIPYLLINKNTFAVVHWREARCYLLGERQDDALLFCPALTPRSNVVNTALAQLERSTKEESIFATFVASSR